MGGDFYDLFQAGDGSWALTIGDVCGKGSRAAAMTALARYTLRAVAAREQRPGRVLNLLNEAIVWQRGGEELCSVAYITPRSRRAHGRADVSSGGHPLPIVVHADGDVEQVGEPGVLLGVEPDISLTDHSVELRPGDAIVLYTDGLTDAFAPHHIVSVPELKGVLAACAGLPPKEIVEEGRARAARRLASRAARRRGRREPASRAHRAGAETATTARRGCWRDRMGRRHPTRFSSSPRR